MSLGLQPGQQPGQRKVHLMGADSSAEPEPDEEDRAKWDQANSRLFSLRFFVTSGSSTR